MKTANFLFPVVVLFFFSHCIMAQEANNDSLDTGEYYQVEYYKFNTGKSSDAQKIIRDYFSVANQLAGIPDPVMTFQVTSDDYDYMVVWEIMEGEDNYNWQSCPTNSEWYNALVTVAGSEEKAKEIIVKYDSYINASKTEFARRQ